MSVTPWRTPTVFAQAAQGTAHAWSNLTAANLAASDDTYATSAPNKSGHYTDHIYATGFGFAADIPAGMSIDGIEVVVERKTSTGTIHDYVVQLYKGGLLGTNQASGVAYTTTDVQATYGGSTNTWGASLTPQAVNSSDFGLDFCAGTSSGSMTVSVDFIAMRVYYSPDTVAPTVTSEKSFTVVENQPFSTTITTDELATLSITGADATLFSLDGSTLSLTAMDFEAPADANADNIYEVTVLAEDLAGNVSESPITVQITNKVDETPPNITNGSTHFIDENLSFNLSLTANEAVTWSIIGGADAAEFTLSDATLSLPPRNYEAPTDANRDNVYEVTVQAEDGSGNRSTQAITVQVSDVFEIDPVTMVITESGDWTVPADCILLDEVHLIGSGGSSSATFGGGGGGAYTGATSVNVTPGTVLSFTVGLGLSTRLSLQGSWGDELIANAGETPSDVTGTGSTNTMRGGVGGSAFVAIGVTSFAGGNGGATEPGYSGYGGGGGGAAGPNGAGQTGGAGLYGGNGSGGGGGANGGQSTAGEDGQSQTGGAGGNGRLGSGAASGSAYNAPASDGFNGGGGGGAYTGVPASHGGVDALWTDTNSAVVAGPGGGGGGGAKGVGAGGSLGFGGGQGGTTPNSRSAGPGVIVLKYRPYSPPPVERRQAARHTYWL